MGFPCHLGLGLLQSLSEGIGIGLFLPLLRGLISGNGSQVAAGGWLMERMDTVFRQVPPDHRLAVIALALFAVVLATALLAYSHDIFFTWIDGRIGHHLRRTIFSQLMAGPRWRRAAGPRSRWSPIASAGSWCQAAMSRSCCG